MSDQAPEVEVTEDDVQEWEGGGSPYDDVPVLDGVGFSDPDATELDPGTDS